MEEILKKYFSINIDLSSENDEVFFSYNSNDYIIIKFKNADFNLLSYLLYYSFFYKPISNIYNQYITKYNEKYYMLFYYTYENIDENDILNFINQNTQIINNNIHDKWCKKVDYHEYQITQFGAKYFLLRESINYVVGLSEIGIELLNTINFNQCYSCYVHKRINKSLFTFKNPLNICIDYRVRDICEYIKYMFFYENKEIFEELITKVNLTSEEYKLLFARLLLITPYYDLYENIIDGKKEESEINNITSKLNNYEKYLKKIYLYIKRYINIDNIELFSN